MIAALIFFNVKWNQLYVNKNDFNFTLTIRCTYAQTYVPKKNTRSPSAGQHSSLKFSVPTFEKSYQMERGARRILFCSISCDDKMSASSCPTQVLWVCALYRVHGPIFRCLSTLLDITNLPPTTWHSHTLSNGRSIIGIGETGAY